MVKKNLFRSLLLIAIICSIPISCTIEKRLYRPGFFIQKRSRPDVDALSWHSKVSAPNIKRIDNSPAQTSIWLDSLHNEKKVVQAKDMLKVNLDSQHVNGNKEILELYEKDETKSITANLNKLNSPRNIAHKGTTENRNSIEENQNTNSNQNLALAFLLGAGSVILITGVRKGIKNYGTSKLSQKYSHISNSITEKNGNPIFEIQEIADRISRCGDRFANANNERMELAARKVAMAVNQSNNLANAKKLEQLFNNTYLSQSNSPVLDYLVLHNLLPVDPAYGTPPPEIVAPTENQYSPTENNNDSKEKEPLDVVDDLSISQTVSDISLEKGSKTTVFAEQVKQGVIDVENFETISAGVKVGGALLGGISVGNDINTMTNWDKNTTATQKLYDASNLLLDASLTVGGLVVATSALAVSTPYVVAGTVAGIAAKVYIHYYPISPPKK